MAYNQIPVDSTKVWGQKLVNTRDRFLQVIEDLREIRGKMQACLDGSDYTQLEAQFGIPTGKGTLLLGELDSMLSKIDTNDETSFTKDAIAQFINFVG